MITMRARWSLIFALAIVASSAHAQLEIHASVPKSRYKVGESIQVLVLLKNVSSRTVYVDRDLSGGWCPDLKLAVEVVRPKVEGEMGGCFGGHLFMTPELQQRMGKFVATANSWSIALEPGYVYGTTLNVDTAKIPRYPASLNLTAAYRVGDFVQECRQQLAAAGFNFAYDLFFSKPIQVQIVDK